MQFNFLFFTWEHISVRATLRTLSDSQAHGNEYGIDCPLTLQGLPAERAESTGTLAQPISAISISFLHHLPFA